MVFIVSSPVSRAKASLQFSFDTVTSTLKLFFHQVAARWRWRQPSAENIFFPPLQVVNKKTFGLFAWSFFHFFLRLNKRLSESLKWALARWFRIWPANWRPCVQTLPFVLGCEKKSAEKIRCYCQPRVNCYWIPYRRSVIVINPWTNKNLSSVLPV